jgi:hypothetical protein
MVFLGVEPRSVGVVLAQGLCDLVGEGITSAEGFRDGEAGRAPFFSLCPGICLTTELATMTKPSCSFPCYPTLTAGEEKAVSQHQLQRSHLENVAAFMALCAMNVVRRYLQPRDTHGVTASWRHGVTGLGRTWVWRRCWEGPCPDIACTLRSVHFMLKTLLAVS